MLFKSNQRDVHKYAMHKYTGCSKTKIRGVIGDAKISGKCQRN